MLVGVDWGGTKIEVVALGEAGAELARVRVATPRSDYDGCLALIASLVGQVESTTGRTGTVGVGLPGSLDPRTGLAKGASSTWLNGRPVESDLERVLDRPVRTSNDADCFAVSEAVDGSGAGYRVVLGVIIGTGTGAGIAIDGRAHHGPNNSAAEYGHNQLPRPDVSEIPGPACYCGRHGCVERWVSGPSFARDYHQHASVDLIDPPRLSAKEILEQVRSGNRLAQLVWDRYLDRLARGLSIVVNTLDPDVIVLGGGMSNIPELYTGLPARVAGATFSPCFYTPIVPATHGDSSGVRGAAWLWKD
ncbi:fructokinase [Friedmanniella luteola]|uniref:Fructokinase n=2 Tax=Friedmanniella luteola TaxID=546871 RepID=A0A1H1M9M0_9ACTN|nr:fructokinase [Friedmanniella luteola]